jgi:putative membrane protein
MPALIAICLLICQATAAVAHGTESHGSLSWTSDPWIFAPLVTIAVLYALGAIRLSRRRHGFPPWMRQSAILFWTGLATLVVALVSPLHGLGEHLFSVHMVEHELIMAVAAPLLVLARPVALLLWGLPANMRRRVGRGLASRGVRVMWQALTIPTVAAVLHGLAIWVWHAPALFDATVSDVLLHRLQHLSFFLTGLLFWWAVIWRCSRGTSAWLLFVTMLHTSILGALIALAPRVLYLAQTRHAGEWGLAPLEDQQLAGIIMWIPGGIVYAAATLWFLATWIQGASTGGENAQRIRLV